MRRCCIGWGGSAAAAAAAAAIRHRLGSARTRCRSAAASSLNWCSADEAVSNITSGQSVFIHSCAMAPTNLVTALARRASPALTNVSVVSIHTEGANDLASEAASISFRPKAFFLGSNLRAAVAAGRADYIPCFLSEIPSLFRTGRVPVDVALIQVSPPDRHGFCTLGLSVDVSAAAVECARTVIAAVNPNVPRTHGDSSVHVSRISCAVATNAPIARPSEAKSKVEPVHEEIGGLVASLIPDEACIQAGIGVVPDAVMGALKAHRRLGVHTEMFSDGMLALLSSGVVTNEHKAVLRGKTVTAFSMGSPELIAFVDDNPSVVYCETSFVNDASVIRRNPRTIAVNSAIEVDLTGQVCADSIGKSIFSGVGGQLDFVRGAALSSGGRAIIAFTSRTARGVSRIVPHLSPGAGVVTTRAHCVTVVTEFGIADLHGKSLRERAMRLRDLAHPDDREVLDREIFERFKFS